MGTYPINIFKKIKSIAVLSVIFSFIRNNKKLSIIKYNNDLKRKLNVILDYEYLIIIDEILIDEISNINYFQKLKFINLDNIDIKEKIKTGEIDIYYLKNKNKIYTDNIYLNTKIYKKIKIIINNKSNFIKTFEFMFHNINILKEINIRYKNCKIEYFNQMFSFSSKLILIRLFFSNVTAKTIYRMFEECTSLKLIDGISEWNTSKITDFGGIFSGCESLEYLPNISEWDTSNSVSMSCMFCRCYSLKELPDFSKWDTSNVIEMDAIFYECKSLKSIPNISEWNTKNVSDMGCMFVYCRSLKLLPDISRWNTDNLKNAGCMFINCKSLESLPDITKWDIKEDCIVEEILENCLSLDVSQKIKNKFKINH